MYTILKSAHSLAAYLTLILLLTAVLYAFYGWINKKPFTNGSKIVFLLALIIIHLQFVFGLALYFLSPLGISNLSGGTMKNSAARLYALEHPLMMLISVILITIGYSRSKRAFDEKIKYKTTSIFYTIGFLLILTRLPWSIWLG
ncbi:MULTISPECIES: hypothetical protein [Flavobacterium]|jgi:hypothetical protein|uniref:Cytochrome B n=1 Tax=Flavobacterium johnsoniae TaxID=986 RepID=A0A1J7BSJ8_FLAJO|nr:MULTISPECIES: hypothetical protein [Flavobacterium]MDQ1166457.1 hypothetical protein [Flavobacterium sp. SORGH_AS_0622]OIV41662.1 hypothetical protein BKM63_14150 [Flavobacterium johnsoniae]